ncbi:ABC transporter substrate-binding protein [Phenylobacterium sp. LjRoot225]|uniref:ABC transporter substrate-binding protein n=1 Tax=Phenylobacterium sp. LjRoot225 TaxID=3342285 RepID=UPI003ECF4092
MVERPDLSRRDALCGLGAASALSLLPEAAAAAPRRGGRIRVATISSSTADTLDPAKGGLSTDYVRHFMVYSGLTQFTDSMAPRLALAEAIETSDRIRWRVRLRKGVAFHDGAPLTSADVVYSLLRHKQPALGSKVKTIADQIVEAKAVGPHEVELQLSGPNADLPAILATSHFLIVKDGTRDFRTANGTGPFRCRAFNPGVRTIVSRNPNYWKPGAPYLDEIELIGIPDEVSRVNALLSGDVQLIQSVNPRSTRRIAATRRHVMMETRSGLYTDLIMRQDRTPTSHPNFVLAMKHLFDRELIRKALYRGYAVVANDQPIPPGHPYYLAGLPQRAHDPDRARFLLKQAGLLNLRLPVYASPAADGSVDMASILQEQAARIGLRLAVNRVPSDGYWSNHWMKHPLTFGNTNPRPTADLVFSLFYKSDAAWNESGWKNARFDQLLLAARAEADETRRKQIYGDMQALVHDHGGVAIPVFISNLDAHTHRLKGLRPIPAGGLMAYSFAEYVWLEG